MIGSERTGRRWFLRLQSAFVLPLARGIYLLVALGCLLAIIGGTLYLVFLQTSIASRPTTVAVPPLYQGYGTVVEPSDRTADLAVVRKRFEPPTNVRFQVAPATLTEPPKQGQVLGYFVADTPNGLASYPEGVSVIGGRDAELFERVADGASKKNGLAARPTLSGQVGEALGDIKLATSRTFEIRVVARDRYGITSAPMDLSFDLKLGPKALASAKPPSEPSAEPPAQPTALESVAGEVARTIQREVNADYIAAYRTALKVPDRCGASDSDDAFVSNYRRALEEVRSRLTASNVEAFYAGLCDAWKEVLGHEAAAQERAEQQQRAAQRVAEEARERAQAQNYELERRHAAKVSDARAHTAATLSVIGGALAIFLSVALVLAFLAIEGHSRAVRAAMESMIRMSEERRSNESVPNNP